MSIVVQARIPMATARTNSPRNSGKKRSLLPAYRSMSPPTIWFAAPRFGEDDDPDDGRSHHCSLAAARFRQSPPHHATDHTQHRKQEQCGLVSPE